MKKILLSTTLLTATIFVTGVKPVQADPISMAIASVVGTVTSTVGGLGALTFTVGSLALDGIGAALAHFAVRAALGYALSALAPKPQAQAARGYGSTVNNLGAALPHAVVYGEVLVGGAIFYQNNSGDTNEYLHRCIAFAAHQIEGFTEIRIDGETALMDSDGFVQTPAKYANLIRIKEHLGSDTQAADTDLVSEISEWTTNHKASGIAYLYCRFEYDTDELNNTPVVTAVVKGKTNIYDPRNDSEDWTANSALCLRDYFVSNFGLGEYQSRRNRLNYSEELDAVDWTDTKMTLTPQAGIGPLGNHNAYGMVSTLSLIGSLAHTDTTARLFTIGTPVTLSQMVKADGRAEISITITPTIFATGGSTRVATFNMALETASDSDPEISSKMVHMGDGWWRCSTIVTPTATAEADVNWFVDSVVGNGSDGFLISAAQLEENNRVTEYQFVGAVWDADLIGAEINNVEFGAAANGCDEPVEIAIDPESGLTPDETWYQDDITTTTPAAAKIDDFFGAFDIGFPDQPSGTIWEQGAALGAYLGVTGSQLVFRAGGGSISNDLDCAKIYVPIEKVAGQRLTIFVSVDYANDTVTMWAYNVAAKTIKQLGHDEASAGFDVAGWTGNNAGGIGIGSSTLVGVGTEDETAFNGIISEARFYFETTIDTSLSTDVERNLLPVSQQFDLADWTKTRTTVSDDIAIGPFGSVTGDKLVEDTANDTHLLELSPVTTVTGEDFTWSIYVKAGERTEGEIYTIMSLTPFTTESRIQFDLDAGTVTAVNGSGTITDAGDGWYRVTATGAALSTSSRARIFLSEGGTKTYLGDGASGFYIDAGQMEAGTAATKYQRKPLDQVFPAAYENRYTCNGTFTLDLMPQDIVRSLLSSMGGMVWYSQGKWGCKAAVYSPPIKSFNEDDLRGTVNLATKHSRRENFNTVRGTWRGPDSEWQETDYSQVTSGQYLAEDGFETITTDLPLPFTSKQSEAIRIATIALKRNRKQLTASAPYGLRALSIGVGDSVGLTNSILGWNDTEFEVIDWTFSQGQDGGLTTDMTVREIDETVFE